MEDVSGEKIPEKASDKGVGEKSFSGNASSSADARIFLGVQSIEQSTGDKIGRPNHRRRGHEEAAGNASDRKADLRRDAIQLR